MSSPIVIHGVSDAPASWNTICGRVPVAEDDLARVGLQQTGDDAQQRRLAAARSRPRARPTRPRTTSRSTPRSAWSVRALADPPRSANDLCDVRDDERGASDGLP